MSLVYLIVQHGGHYANEDVYHTTLAASLDPAKAQEYRDKLRADYVRETEIYNAVEELIAKADVFEAFYEKSCPPPESAKGKDWPRWRAGIRQQDITQAMRDERQAIKDENARVMEEFRPIYGAWCSAKRDATNAFMQAQEGYSDEVKARARLEEGKWHPYDDRNETFEVESVELI